MMESGVLFTPKRISCIQLLTLHYAKCKSVPVMPQPQGLCKLTASSFSYCLLVSFEPKFHSTTKIFINVQPNGPHAKPIHRQRSLFRRKESIRRHRGSRQIHLFSSSIALRLRNGRRDMSSSATNTTRDHSKHQAQHVHYPFWFGGSASCFAAAVTHPLDLSMKILLPQ